jgi:predicted O-methyltransferase YrrM
MELKHVLPAGIRQVLRPTWHRMQRDWRESPYSTKPADWAEPKARAHASSDFAELMAIAEADFGITQMPMEISGLISRLRQLQPRTFVEVGTHKGGNSFLFAHAVPGNEVGIGIDLCVQNAAKLKHFSRPGQRYHALHGNSQTAQMRERARRLLKGKPLDFLFIDGDHRYEGAKADFELYSALVRPGGLIAFHDICPDHKTLYGIETGCYAGEVYTLWAELKQQFPEHEELIQAQGQDGFGIGILRWPGSAARD